MLLKELRQKRMGVQLRTEYRGASGGRSDRKRDYARRRMMRSAEADSARRFWKQAYQLQREQAGSCPDELRRWRGSRREIVT